MSDNWNTHVHACSIQLSNHLLMATALQRYRWLASATIDAAVDCAFLSDASAASARRLAAAKLAAMSSVAGISTPAGARCKRTSIGVRSSAGGAIGTAGATTGGAGERSGGSCSASKFRPSVCGAGVRQSSSGAPRQAFPPWSPSADSRRTASTLRAAHLCQSFLKLLFFGAQGRRLGDGGSCGAVCRLRHKAACQLSSGAFKHSCHSRRSGANCRA